MRSLTLAKCLTGCLGVLLAVMATSCCPHRFVPAECPETLPSFYVPEKIRVALVLGSGGVRGMAHVGVIEEFEAAGIPIDIIVGCSAGSIVGALYADNPDVEALKCAVWDIKTRSMLDIDLLNCRYGLSQDKSMRRTLNHYLGSDCFENLQIPLVVVASDLHTGELVPIGSGGIVKAVQASCSMPFIFVPCEYRGRVLVDGGVVNPTPVCVARDLGADIIVAVDLCELLPKTFPTNLFQVLQRSIEIAFMWQNDACTCGADVIIRPKTCGMGCFGDDKEKEMIYWAGRAAAREQISRLLTLLSCRDDEEAPCGWRLVCPQAYCSSVEFNSGLVQDLYTKQEEELEDGELADSDD